jgi:hypothetical protein
MKKYVFLNRNAWFLVIIPTFNPIFLLLKDFIGKLTLVRAVDTSQTPQHKHHHGKDSSYSRRWYWY